MICNRVNRGLLARADAGTACAEGSAAALVQQTGGAAAAGGQQQQQHDVPIIACTGSDGTFSLQSGNNAKAIIFAENLGRTASALDASWTPDGRTLFVCSTIADDDVYDDLWILRCEHVSLDVTEVVGIQHEL